jgi:putative ABC transport system permease protein
MIGSYLKSAVRSVRKNRSFTILNILGLTSGMAVALLIGLWVQYEYSYDRFLPDYQQVYKVKLNATTNGQVHTQDAVPLPLEQIMKDEVPGIHSIVESDFMTEHGLKVGDNKLYIKGGFAGADFLSMFQYLLLAGKADQCLRETYSIVLTRSTAIALFGTSDPMGKQVRLDNQHDLVVTGLMQDIPPNSSLQFNFLVPFSYYEQTHNFVKQSRTQWGVNSFQLFVSLDKKTNPGLVQASIRDIIHKHDNTEIAEPIIYPLKDWWLYSEFKDGKPSGGLISYIRIFVTIAIVALLMACINFVNLSTAQSEKKSREVGVRKVLGSSRKDLVFQFLFESLILTVGAAMLSLLIVQLSLPSFNVLADTNVSIPWTRPFFWLALLLFIAVTTLLAGVRPAFYFSSIKPIKALKPRLRFGKSTLVPREIFVILQFTCSIILIIATIVIYRQINFAKDRVAGYDQDGLVITDMNADLRKSYPALRDELLTSGVILNVTKASNPITAIYIRTSISSWPGKNADESLDVATISVGNEYFRTTGLHLVEGHTFTGIKSTDSAAAILNLAAVRRMALKTPIGSTISWNGQNFRIIGVAADAVMESPFKTVDPTLYISMPGWESSIMYRLNPNWSTQKAIAELTRIFNKYSPAYPFIYRFASDAYASKFKMELLIGRLALLFAGLTIFISCLGLFGIAAYLMRLRRREVSIRKVLGASMTGLWLMLLKRFLGLSLISCVIASVISQYYLSQWLANYEYRISISAWVFLSAAALTVAITLLTVSSQIIRVSLSNPAKILYTE